MKHMFVKTTDNVIKQRPEEDYGMNSPSSKSELIEPMIFDCSSSKSELIEPMIFDESPSESKLIEPMIFDKLLPESKDAVPIIHDISPFISKPLNDQIQQELKPRVGSASDLEYGISLSKKHEIPNCLCEADARSSVVHPMVKKDIRPTAYSIAKTLMNKVALCVYNNQLLYYTGQYYKKISESDIKRLIISECRTDVERSGTAKILSDTVEFLLHEPQLLKNYDENKTKISFLNCVLDLKTGIVYPHHPSIFTTYCIECNYPNNTYSPIFDDFLMQITGEDKGIIQRILEMIGYVLSPDTGGKVFFVLQGCPNSGKSVLSALIPSFFDSESVSAMDIHSLNRQFAPSELADKMICVSPDLPSGIIDDKSVSKLKQFTGNDLASADRKNKNFIQFKCKARFILATNHILLTK